VVKNLRLNTLYTYKNDILNNKVITGVDLRDEEND